MAYQKMYMVPAKDPAMVNLFKGRLTVDPTLDTAAKLLTRKMEILKNPNTSHGFKKQAIKQIDPDIELYVKKNETTTSIVIGRCRSHQVGKILKRRRRRFGDSRTTKIAEKNFE